MDNLLILNRTEYVGPSRVDVHEHRASTDESLKLLKEMQEKAKDSLIDAFVVKNTIFQTELAVFIMASEFNTKIVNYKMKVNGTDFRGSFKVDFTNDRETILQETFKKVSEAITEKIFNSDNNFVYNLMSGVK